MARPSTLFSEKKSQQFYLWSMILTGCIQYSVDVWNLMLLRDAIWHLSDVRACDAHRSGVAEHAVGGVHRADDGARFRSRRTNDPTNRTGSQGPLPCHVGHSDA